MKTVVVHDWLYTYVGSERVLESILRCIPVETLFTLVDFLPDDMRSFLNNVPVKHSFLQDMPLARSLRRYYLPLMPIAIEGFDVSSADLVISSSSAIAKGILTNSEQLHICYCYSPGRYFYDLTHQYLQGSNIANGFKGFIARMIFNYLRIWDVSNSNRVDYFVTLSHYIARRIWHIFRRKSTVIYPPVDVDNFRLNSNKDDYYFTVSRLESYKKVDLIVEAFAYLKKKLIVVGDGPELNKIKAKATPNIDILGYQSNEVVQDLMERARAFIFAADEDFGIVNLEAQASGTPVIAFGRGGSLETAQGVFPGTKPVAGTTGIFFKEQTVPSLSEALNWFEKHENDIAPGDCRKNAERFARPRFEREFKQFVEAKWQIFNNDRRQRL